LVTELERAEGDERERLSGLLKRCRTRIGPERASLGPYLRLLNRIGKAVTQEEVAEAVGISRVWYARMESDRALRVSAAVLGRIADALMMDPPERSALFRLAVPELRSVSLTDRSTALLEALGSLRQLQRRLWVATTEADALTIVREHAITKLGADAMLTFTRAGEDQWDFATTGDPIEDDRATRFFGLLRERLAPTELDDLACYTLIAEPGELITRSERDVRFPDIAAKDQSALAAVDWADMSFAMANVRSQRGFVARIMALHDTAHAFSEIERAELSALADITSLALSGCVSSSR
jgi:transcriptional regulator with XRE-family HTH domain